MTDRTGFGTSADTMAKALDLDPGFDAEFRANIEQQVAAVLASGPRGTMDGLPEMPHFLAALAADGLTVTTAERAAVGEAVERLDGTNISVIERDPSDGQWCISGDGSSEDDWHDTLQAAIAAGLKGIGRSM